MTGYYIQVGYNSAFGDEEVWNELKRVALEIADKPDMICLEADRLDEHGMASLKEYAEAFAVRDDLTFRIKDEWNGFGDEADFQPQIVMLASGGNPSRMYKESVRRAFIRLVLAEMHSRQMEINIQVA